MKKKKRIKDLEKRVKSLEEYVDNENKRRFEELRAAIKKAEFNAHMADIVNPKPLTPSSLC